MKKCILGVLLCMTTCLVGCRKKSMFSGFNSFIFIFKAIKWIFILIIIALILNTLSKVIRDCKGVACSVKESPRPKEIPSQSSHEDRVKKSSYFD